LPQEVLRTDCGCSIPDNSLRPPAIAALERVVNHSELAELWAETGDDSWTVQRANGRDRVTATI